MKKLIRVMLVLMLVISISVSFCACATAAGLAAEAAPAADVVVGENPGAQYIMTYIKDIICTAVIALAGWIALQLRPIIIKFFSDKIRRQIANICMNAVEQIYKTLHGEEKLNKALEMAAEMLKKRGIEFDVADMRNMIEAAVCAFNANLVTGILVEEREHT